MNITLVTPAYPPFPGGAERYAAELAAALHAEGHAITVVTSHATAESDFWQGRDAAAEWRSADGIDVLRLPLAALPGGRAALLALRAAMVQLSGGPAAFAAEQRAQLLAAAGERIPHLRGLAQALAALPPPDIIHAFNISWEAALLAADDWAQRSGRPLVVTPFAHFADDPLGQHGRNSLMAHQRAVLQRAAAVAALTPVELDGLAAWGMQPQRAAVIGGGLGPLPPFELAAADGLGLPPRYALFIGRASADKGALLAAQAVQQLNAEGLPLALVLVGQPHTDFTRFAARLPAGAPIVALGVLSEAQKHAVLARAELLVLPSRTESFGIVVLEAWAHGKPVVVAAAGGLTSLVQDGRNGLLVQPDNGPMLASALRLLLSEPGLGAALGAAGRARVEQQYRWPAVVARQLALYRAALGEAAAP